MQLIDYFKILEKNKSIFSSNRDFVSDKINALQNIWEIGNPSLIPNLFPYLKSDSKEIREFTFFIIDDFFNKLDKKNHLYETLRYCEVKIADFKFFKNNFSVKDYFTLIQIASQNRNGYIREFAVEELSNSENSDAIKFIIFRLSDWVEIIRNKAVQALVNFKKIEYLNCLVENLYLFEWIIKTKRANLTIVYENIFQFILEEENYLLDNIKNFSEKNRIILARKVYNSKNENDRFFKEFLNDKNYLVRIFALKKFDILNKIEIENLLKDKSSKIRLQTLFEIDKRKNLTSEIALNFVADESAAIRDLARKNLRNVDFAEIYADNIKNNKNLKGSIFGLSEVQGKKYVNYIFPFLTCEKTYLVKIAFLSIEKLEPQIAFDFAYENFENKNIFLRNFFVKYFVKHYTEDVLEKARYIYKTGDYEARKSMLRLFSSIGKYITISDLMIGLIDENPALRDLSVNYIENWKLKTNSYFIEPDPALLKKSKEIHEIVCEILKEKKYFYRNPLENLDFYFK